MKILPCVIPTSEQLRIISSRPVGVSLVRGAAGSGKTTTALLMLRTLAVYWSRHFERTGVTEKPRVLVLTYNRTLRGYINELAVSQLKNLGVDIDYEVSTFGKWSKGITKEEVIVGNQAREKKWRELGAGIPLKGDFLVDEIDYCLGRFQLNELDKYVSKKRVGRGISPRVDVSLRRRLIDEVILPYQEWKNQQAASDWNDLALELLSEEPKGRKYDLIIADEAQDFSANQIRAINWYAEDESSLVFVLDAAQKIYPRGWTWIEAGVQLDHIFPLKQNHRNTKQICEFATPLLRGLDIGDDGTMPNLSNCDKSGPMPVVLSGKFSDQANYAINDIKSRVDLSKESVAFLHPKGHGWFDGLRGYLRQAGLDYVELSLRSEWPEGNINIGLSTIHSVKGLEFDHVYILGLSASNMPHGDQEGDTKLEELRRKLAMAITRARLSVVLGAKPEEQTDLLEYLDKDTYNAINL